MRYCPNFALLVAAILSIYHVSEGSSERILIFHGIASYSHRVQTFPVAEALSKQGHQVSYLSPFYPKQPNPNITEFVPQEMADYVDEFLGDEFDIRLRVNNTMDKIYDTCFRFAYETCEVLLQSSEFKQWFKKSDGFDLAIIDNCFPECGMNIAHQLGAKKFIIFDTVATLAHEYDTIGFLPESSSVPELENNPPKRPMGFFERVSNTMTSLQWRFKYYFYSQQLEELVKDALPSPNMPSIAEFWKKVNLVFYTGDVLTDYPRAFPPLFVNVAGTHCKESTQSLPKEMEMFINSTKPGEQDDGFIYISLGSLVVSSNLPDDIKQVFFDVIKAFPSVKFLWKWNGDNPSDIPQNLYLSKWFPQIDVLGHPKIRAFVTQSGRPSTLEALYLGVPMISFPILGDQDANADRMSEMGATITLEIGTINFEEFRDAVKKVVYDPSVKTRMTTLQRIFRDRPMTPVETAVWWVEYVLRNEDTAHLRPSGSDQYWFVRRQVDVWAFLSIGAFLILTSIVVIAWKVSSIMMVKILPSKLKKA